MTKRVLEGKIPGKVTVSSRELQDPTDKYSMKTGECLSLPTRRIQISSSAGAWSPVIKESFFKHQKKHLLHPVSDCNNVHFQTLWDLFKYALSKWNLSQSIESVQFMLLPEKVQHDIHYLHIPMMKETKKKKKKIVNFIILIKFPSHFQKPPRLEGVKKVCKYCSSLRT